MRHLRRLWRHVRPSPTDVRQDDKLIEALAFGAPDDGDGFERTFFLSTLTRDELTWGA